MNRREFLLLAGAMAGACQVPETSPKPAAASGHAGVIDAGPVEQFAADGLYSAYRDQGFFIIRSGGKLSALSSYCTHRRCKLDAEPNHSFSCPCHGSTFDPTGKVTDGPAVRDLPRFETSIQGGRVLVSVPQMG
jgi:Rieske Fe-S protein